MKRHSQETSINLRHQMLSSRTPVIIRPLRMEVLMDEDGQMSPGELENQGILGRAMKEGGPEYIHGILQTAGRQGGAGTLR